MPNALLSRRKLWALSICLPGLAASAHAAVIPFALFSDSSPDQWNYSFGNITANGATANFVAFGGVNQILNYSGSVTYSVDASSTGLPVNNGGVISQPFGGHMVFKNGSITILDVLFAGALLHGTEGSISTGVSDDTTLAGQIISYSTDPSVAVAGFNPPFSFSISLSQVPGIGLDATQTHLNPFTATASGTFAAEQPPSGVGVPEPASLSLITLATPLLLRRRRSR